MPNKENINKLIEWLRADNAKHFKMSFWAAYLDEPDREVINYEYCNTAFCLGGYVDLLVQKDNGIDDDQLDVSRKFDYHYTELGRDYLGISEGQAANLFSFHSAGIDMSEFDELSNERRSAAAIRVLEILRDEDEVMWSRALNETGAIA